MGQYVEKKEDERRKQRQQDTQLETQSSGNGTMGWDREVVQEIAILKRRQEE